MPLFDGYWRNRARIEAAATEKTAQAISVYEVRLQALEASVGAGADAYARVDALDASFEGFKREIQDELARAVRERKARDNRATKDRRGGPPTRTFTEAELRHLIRVNMDRLKVDKNDPLEELKEDDTSPTE